MLSAPKKNKLLLSDLIFIYQTQDNYYDMIAKLLARYQNQNDLHTIMLNFKHFINLSCNRDLTKKTYLFNTINVINYSDNFKQLDHLLSFKLNGEKTNLQSIIDLTSYVVKNSLTSLSKLATVIIDNPAKFFVFSLGVAAAAKNLVKPTISAPKTTKPQLNDSSYQLMKNFFDVQCSGEQPALTDQCSRETTCVINHLPTSKLDISRSDDGPIGSSGQHPDPTDPTDPTEPSDPKAPGKPCFFKVTSKMVACDAKDKYCVATTSVPIDFDKEFCTTSMMGTCTKMAACYNDGGKNWFNAQVPPYDSSISTTHFVDRDCTLNGKHCVSVGLGSGVGAGPASFTYMYAATWDGGKTWIKVDDSCMGVQPTLNSLDKVVCEKKECIAKGDCLDFDGIRKIALRI